MSKKLTTERSMADFKKAYSAKRKLIERQKEDFLFALGKQWDDDVLKEYKDRKIKPVTDNRIQPNLFLLTGLERQNRSEFRAFPEGEEDSIRAEIASSLFKHSIKMSDFLYKTSEQFKDGVTCGESHLELYLDNTFNLLNGKPIWKKGDGNAIFPEPGFREYDFNDARYVYKLTKDLSEDDLISLFPKKKTQIENVSDGKVDFTSLETEGVHTQKKDYPTKGGESGEDGKEKGFDLIERYYKKFIEKHFVGDKSTGTITEAEDKEKAEGFVNAYQQQILQDQAAYGTATQQYAFDNEQYTQAAMVEPNVAMVMAAPTPPPEPPQHDPERFIHFTRLVPEIWYFAHVQGMKEPLADEVAWFYPKWKNYPFIPYFARFSTAPITGDDRHLLIQGIVHGVKNVQEVHNKQKTLELLHLNTSANSGWLAEEDAWVDEQKVKTFGATPGANLYYKKGSPIPTRIFPNPLSQGHAQIAQEAADAIKAGLGINSDLLAAQDGSSQSGRAIALRQRQGLLMVQELFDNLSRSRQIAGKFLLSQLGEMYDTDTAKKVLGEAFLIKNFGTPKLAPQMDPMTGQPAVDQMGQPVMGPEIGPDGQPVMEINFEVADQAIADVLSGDLGTYDVAVGESVSSETLKLANNADLKEFATTYPGLLPPEVLIEESLLPQATKTKVVSAIKNAQAAAAAQAPLALAGR